MSRKSLVAIAPTDPKTFGPTITRMAAIQVQSDKKEQTSEQVDKPA
jgi:hypothetical protein